MAGIAAVVSSSVKNHSKASKNLDSNKKDYHTIDYMPIQEKSKEKNWLIPKYNNSDPPALLAFFIVLLMVFIIFYFTGK